MSPLVIGAAAVVVGALAAGVHLAFARRDVARAVAAGTLAPLALGAPVRLGLPASALALCAAFGHGAGIAGGLVGFALTRRLARELARRSAP